MRHWMKRRLALNAVLLALLTLTACARPGAAPPLRDDTRDIDHPDRGMRDSHDVM
jgi:hypothetical protein